MTWFIGMSDADISTQTLAYTVSASYEARITVEFTNRSTSTSATASLWVVPSGEGVATQHIKESGTTLGLAGTPQAVLVRRVIAPAGAKIYVQASNANVSCQLSGDVVSPDNTESALTTAITAATTFAAAGTGATDRTFQNKMRDIVSVKDFGAVGDGVTDDSAAVAAALVASASVFVPVGNYLVVAGTNLNGLYGVGKILIGTTYITLPHAPSTENIDAANLKKWRVALAKVVAGTADARVFCVGDSTTMGAGSNGSLSADVRAKSYPTRLAERLTALGFSSYQGSGNYNGGVTLTTSDPRWTFGGGWGENGTATLGGPLILNTTTTNTLSFSPGVTFDTITVWYVRNASFGTFDIKVDGGAALTSVNSAGATAFMSATVSCVNTSVAIQIVPTTIGNGIYIAAIEVALSTAKKVLISNFGWSGAASVSFITSAAVWNAIPAITTMAPDLTIICLDLNDITLTTAIATYKSQIQTIITGAKAGGGDVVLMCSMPGGTAPYTSTGATYVNALRSLALSNSCPFVDMDFRCTSYAASPAAIYFDTLHPTALGYVDIARVVANTLTV